MLAIAAIGHDINFATLKTVPFSNVTYFRTQHGHLRSMRITDWGGSVMVLRKRLDGNFYDDEIVTARYVVGELVQPDPASPNGWSTVFSAVQPGSPIVAVTVFVAGLQNSYGKSWIHGGVTAENFLREVLASLR